MRILLVDGSPEDAGALERVLQEAGYDATTAPEGGAALSAAREDPPDLVISDVLLPVMDGYRLFAAWLRDPLLRQIPFIFLTGTFTGPEDEARAHSLGVTRFLRKPIAPEDLVREVDDVLRQARHGMLGHAGTAPSEDDAAPLKPFNEQLVLKLRRNLEASRRECARLEASMGAGQDSTAAAIQQLKAETQARKRAERVNSALYAIAKALNTSRSLDELFRSIHAALGAAVDTTNFYVALFHRERNSITFAYFVDEKDSEPEIRDATSSGSMTAEVILSQRTLFLRKGALQRRYGDDRRNPSWGTPPEVWLGVPLKARDTVIGALVVQSYTDPAAYSEEDVALLEAVSEQVAMAIDHKRGEEIRDAAYQITEAAQSAGSLEELYKAIHQVVGELMHARNFYIALHDPATDLLTFPYFVDENDPAPAPMKAGKTLTAYVLKTGQPLLASPEVFQELLETGQVEDAGSPSIDWLGIPLRAQGRIIGVLVVQSYTEGIRYGTTDIDMLTFVSSQVAMAIERKRFDQAIRRSEERYRTLLENLGEGVWVFGAKFEIIFANTAAERMLGCPPGGLEGRNLVDFVHEDRIPDLHELGHKLKSGEKGLFEFTFHGPGGQPTNLLLMATPRFEEGGAFQGGMCVLLDVTDQRKAEADKHLLTSAIEQTGEAVFVIDMSKRIVYVNHAFEVQTGYSREEVKGELASILRAGMAEDDPAIADVRKAIEERRPWAGRMEFRRKDGRPILAQSTISPVKNPGGQTEAFVCTQRDLTDELETLDRLNKAKTREVIGLLAQGVAHEVRNPLFAINLNLSAMQRQLEGKTAVTPFMGFVQEHVRRLDLLMKDLLELGQPLGSEDFKACVLQEVILAASKEVQSGLQESAGRLVVDLPDEPMTLRASPNKIRQAFVHILNNAFQNSPPDGSVYVRSEPDALYWVVHVVDEGPGIPESMSGRLFDPFVTGHKGRKGLGLSLVQHYLEAHRGILKASNNESSPGAKFTVMLPKGD